VTEKLDPIPLDDEALNAIEHALGAVYVVDDDGEHQITGAEYNLSQLLDFWSGHDHNDGILVDQWGDTKVYGYTKPVYHEKDLIRALVAEVRRLREAQP